MSEAWPVLKAALLALLVAMLIWIWAEGESLSTRTTEAIAVDFPTEPGNDLVIRPDDPQWKGVVRIRLEGPVRSVNRALTALGTSIHLAPTLEGMPTGPTRQMDLSLRRAIADLPELSPLSGVVAEVEPARVMVTAERMVTRELPIALDLPREIAIDGDPVINPDRVRIRLPETLSQTLPPDARAVAAPSDSELIKLRADGPQTILANIRPPLRGLSSGTPLVVEPQQVQVTLRLRQAIDSVTLPTVPVWFSLPPTEDGAKWNIEILDKFLTDVTVSGPSEEVQRVKAGRLAIKALIEFTTDELERAAATPSTDPAGNGSPASSPSTAPAVEFTKRATFAGTPAALTCTVADATVRVRVSRRQGQ